MMVDLPWLFLCAESFNVSLQEDVNEWLEQVEQKPDVDHLDIGSLGEIVTYVDEHRCQDQHYRHIQGNNSLRITNE